MVTFWPCPLIVMALSMFTSRDHLYVPAATTMLVDAAEAEPLCGGRLVSVLEGGYDVAGETVAESGLAHCAKAHVLALMGDLPPPREHRVVESPEEA